MLGIPPSMLQWAPANQSSKLEKHKVEACRMSVIVGQCLPCALLYACSVHFVLSSADLQRRAACYLRRS